MKRRIMIADNSEVFCNGLVQSLKKYDMVEVVGAAHDGEQTVRMVKQLKPDMLVLDLLLPKLDGIGVLKEIYNMEKRPIVVATSGFITDYVASSVACLGARYLMLKPCDITSLSELIEGCWNENDLQKRPRESTATRIENLATDVLHDIGVPANIKGYRYLREAIKLAAEDLDRINNMTECIYKPIALADNSTPKRVRTAITRAIEIAWDRGDLDTLQSFFGYTVSNTKGKPTNSEFIALLADKLSLRMNANGFTS